MTESVTNETVLQRMFIDYRKAATEEVVRKYNHDEK